MSAEQFMMIDMMARLLSAGALGILGGALLAEGFLLVPYWRTLPPAEFFALHPSYGPRLFRFFAPLTIAGPILSVLAAMLPLSGTGCLRGFSVLAALLACSMVGMYFFFFSGVNALFAARQIRDEDLAATLKRWAIWHGWRVVIALLAFGCSLLAIAD